MKDIPLVFAADVQPVSNNTYLTSAKQLEQAMGSTCCNCPHKLELIPGTGRDRGIWSANRVRGHHPRVNNPQAGPSWLTMMTWQQHHFKQQ